MRPSDVVVPFVCVCVCDSILVTDRTGAVRRIHIVFQARIKQLLASLQSKLAENRPGVGEACVESASVSRMAAVSRIRAWLVG